MEPEIRILAATAASIGFLHTLTGPDHYLPFIVLSRARRWSTAKTLWITILCGIGHVLGSVVLGIAGIALGVAVAKLEVVEGVRGDLAAWLLISFGLVYMVWGLRRAWRRQAPHHHVHADGTVHAHGDGTAHAHGHDRSPARSMTPWALFIIFVLGPCEPLIPILMYPAARHNVGGLALVTAIFAVTTIGTMTAMVLLAGRGVRLLPTDRMERYTHALAGGAICASGLAIRFLGL